LLNSVGSDGFHQQLGGCLKDFRNKPYAVRAKVEYYKKALTVTTILCSLNSFFIISWRIEGWVVLGDWDCSAYAPVCVSQYLLWQTVRFIPATLHVAVSYITTRPLW